MSESKTIELPQGRLSYRDAGQGEPIVFVHGFLVDGRLWDKPAAALSSEFRCIQPDWPMGSHRTPMAPDADLSPPGMARLIADFVAALDLERVTIVGNDSGGAISQVLVTSHPERIGRLVLTNCDSHENFPPAPFGQLPRIVRVPGAMAAMVMPLRFAAVRRAAFAPFARSKVPDELLASWVKPCLTNAGVRRDARKFTMGMDKRHTLEAADRLEQFDKPVLLAWAPEDRVFKLAYAERLAEAIPDARIERIEGAKTFVALDQPERLAEAIAAFVRETAPTSAAA